jgi:hypothetical protein
MAVARLVRHSSTLCKRLPSVPTFANICDFSNGNLYIGNNNADESRAAASTIDAADFLVRQNDPARLKTWLAKHSADERAAILKHIRRGKG